MRAFYLVAALALAACSDTTSIIDEEEPPPLEPPAAVQLREIASGLTSPVFLTAPPGDPRLFVVEQPGRVRVIVDGQLLPTPFLDLTSVVLAGGERGLLGLAFHPRYAENGYLYVNYTDRGGDTRVERYRVSLSNPDRAEPASAKLVLAVDQPFANHNGGMIQFGADGMLYVGMGDGGGGGDPLGHARNRGTLLGAMLRIDVDRGDPYAIPADNPYVGVPGARGEIWAIGLRNPWRWSFDREGGLLYIADVGQGAWEEINVVEAGRAGVDYGWNVMEGAHCYAAATCAQAGLQLPALEYPHEGGACSVTGGFVYRGAALPALRGHYFYSDFCAGWVRSFRYTGGAATDRTTWEVGDVGNVLSYGTDAAGELYLLSSNGRVYRLEPK